MEQKDRDKIMKFTEGRLHEFCEFYGWPKGQTRELFKCSTAFFECVWRGLDPQTEEEAQAYFAGPWMSLRQMAYGPKFAPNKKVRDVIDEMKPGEWFLDYGCGVGDSLIYAEKRGVHAVGTEVKGKLSFLDFRREKRKHTWKAFPPQWLGVNKFDRSVICGSLDHMDDPVAVAKLLCRVTKGHILATPRIDDTYDRPTHVPRILKQLPEAFNLIDEHNAKAKK